MSLSDDLRSGLSTVPLLEVNDLVTTFDTEAGTATAVAGLSFEVDEGETLAIVGESGCGKTATALSILRLLPHRIGRIAGGEVLFRGQDVVQMGKKDLNEVRGSGIGMIFQDALTALNPVYPVGNQIAERIRAHSKVTRTQAANMAVELLDEVGIPNPSARARDYVHQFSGGMRQRAMIAVAIALEPELLIADEPTTALDVTVQAQVLDTLLELKERLGMAMILITHDLGVVAGTADRVMVMYAGQKVEERVVDDLYHRPVHPYTWGLMRSMPRVDDEEMHRLYQIPGAPPSLISPPTGCRYSPRCAYVQERCLNEAPEVREIRPTVVCRCHFADTDGWDSSLTPDQLRANLAETPT